MSFVEARRIVNRDIRANWCHVGIDPGKSGGIAWIVSDTCQAAKMPETERGLYELLRELAEGPTVVTVEKQWARPGMDKVEKATEISKGKGEGQFRGSVSNATLMQNYGTILGILASLCVEPILVAPLRWQNRLNCRTRGDKNITKAKAIELFPGTKVFHWNADAYLLAHYGRLYG